MKLRRYVMNTQRGLNKMPSYKTVEHLLKKICGKFTNKGLDMEDLMQEARLIAWLAESKFKPSLGYAWTTFAGKVVYNELKRKLYYPSGERRYSKVEEDGDEAVGGLCPVEAAEISEIIDKIRAFRQKRPKNERSPSYLNESQDYTLGVLLSDRTIPRNLWCAKKSAIQKLEAHLKETVDSNIEIVI